MVSDRVGFIEREGDRLFSVQSAIFYEIGQVSPTDNDALYSGFKYSTGVGLRLVFSSVVLRADYATGKEGQETTVFIGYGF